MERNNSDTNFDKASQGVPDLGEEAWYNGESLNTLVVLDEAHRFAGKRHENDRNHSHLEGLKDRLIDYARTTRKFGLGWMFISTSLSSIDRDILQQLKIVFFRIRIVPRKRFSNVKRNDS